MSFTLHLSPFTRKQLYRRLQPAYAIGALRLVKRIHALLALAEDMSVQEVAAMLGVGEQTVRDYRNGFLLRHLASLTYLIFPFGYFSRIDASFRLGGHAIPYNSKGS